MHITVETCFVTDIQHPKWIEHKIVHIPIEKGNSDASYWINIAPIPERSGLCWYEDHALPEEIGV